MEGQHFWSRIISWCYRDEISYLYYSTPDQILNTAPPPFPGVRIVACDQESLELVAGSAPDLPPVVEQRVRQGHLAMMAMAEDEWIFRSVIILGPKTCTLTGYPLALTIHDAFMECAETHPAWRGRGVAPGMLGPTALELAARGIRHVYLLINTTNTASCRAAEKGGATQVAVITGRRRLGRWTAAYERVTSEALAPFIAS